MHQTRRVAVFVGAVSTSARGVLRGISAYALPTKPWIFRWAGQALEVIPQIRAWNPDGVIAWATTPKICRALAALHKPIVDVGNWVSSPAIPVVTWDETQTGRRAACHLMENGLRNFACLGIAKRTVSMQRLGGFRSALAEAGFTCHAHIPFDSAGATTTASTWRGIDRDLRRWVESLPKPVGLFAGTDAFGLVLLEVCRLAGIRVPEDVALVGAGDDVTTCTIAYPPLSSIKLHGEPVGYHAAHLLDRLMQGRRSPRSPLLLPPGDAVVRQSSDTVAINDPLLSAALRFIRLHAHQGATIREILAAVPVRRRALEQGFRKMLGRSPLQEIHRVRIAHAKQSLESTDISMIAIAQRSGFSDSKRFALVFKQTVGVPPSVYRRKFRVHDESVLQPR